MGGYPIFKNEHPKIYAVHFLNWFLLAPNMQQVAQVMLETTLHAKRRNHRSLNACGVAMRFYVQSAMQTITRTASSRGGEIWETSTRAMPAHRCAGRYRATSAAGSKVQSLRSASKSSAEANPSILVQGLPGAARSSVSGR